MGMILVLEDVYRREVVACGIAPPVDVERLVVQACITTA